MNFKCEVCQDTGVVFEYCENCNGSGEGMYAGSTCSICKGSGVRLTDCLSCKDFNKESDDY